MRPKCTRRDLTEQPEAAVASRREDPRHHANRDSGASRKKVSAEKARDGVTPYVCEELTEAAEAYVKEQSEQSERWWRVDESVSQCPHRTRAVRKQPGECRDGQTTPAKT